MIEILIPILVFIAIVMIGGAMLIAARPTRRPLTARLEGAAGALAAQPPRRTMLHAIGDFGRLFARNSSEALREQLNRAGYYSEAAPTAFIGIKVLLLTTVCLGATVILLPVEMALALRLYLIIMFAGLAFFLPNIVVGARRRGRQTEVQNHLPDAIDLLEVCVSSGMGLDMAWNCVSDEIRGVSPVLADEMALTNLEMQLGASRTQAMRNLARRTGADEFNSLVALLVQSERFGTSIADALAQFAESMRELRTQKAEEASEKMAVKLLLPLVIFIFPVLLIVMVGPAALSLAKIITAG